MEFGWPEEIEAFRAEVKAFVDGLMTDEFRGQMEASTPLRRLGQPIDIALAVLYLCSPAGSFITGKILEVDGGIESPNLPLGLPDLA